jgi:hypothetical protein
MREVRVALFVCWISFEMGRFTLALRHFDFKRLGLEFFVLTPEHIKLLQRLTVYWRVNPDGYGAPTVDVIRPYGNSDIHGDIAELLGLPQPDWEAGATYSPDQIVLMDTFHRETEFALQVVLQTGQFQPGLYVRRWYTNWILVVAGAPDSIISRGGLCQKFPG